MSRLSVYWPEEVNLPVKSTLSPMILPFRANEPAATASPRQMNVVERARAFYDNRTCQHCGYPVTEPIELDDAILNRNGHEIPGTATLVGFHCCGCDREWSV